MMLTLFFLKILPSGKSSGSSRHTSFESISSNNFLTSCEVFRLILLLSMIWIYLLTMPPSLYVWRSSGGASMAA